MLTSCSSLPGREQRSQKPAFSSEKRKKSGAPLSTAEGNSVQTQEGFPALDFYLILFLKPSFFFVLLRDDWLKLPFKFFRKLSVLDGWLRSKKLYTFSALWTCFSPTTLKETQSAKGEFSGLRHFSFSLCYFSAFSWLCLVSHKRKKRKKAVSQEPQSKAWNSLGFTPLVLLLCDQTCEFLLWKWDLKRTWSRLTHLSAASPTLSAMRQANASAASHSTASSTANGALGAPGLQKEEQPRLWLNITSHNSKCSLLLWVQPPSHLLHPPPQQPRPDRMQPTAPLQSLSPPASSPSVVPPLLPPPSESPTYWSVPCAWCVCLPSSCPSCWAAVTAPASAACASTCASKSLRAESSWAAPSALRGWPRDR